MRWDRQLIQVFLDGYNGHAGVHFAVESYPEDTERQATAVDVIARDHRGTTLAIEHTLVQPFGGEREERSRFLKVLGRLEGNEELKVPGYWICILVSVGALPKRVNWESVGSKLQTWLRQIRRTLPDGKSEHTISDVGFDLSVTAWKRPVATGDGVYVGRFGMPSDFCQVVRERVEAKLPKLVDTPADQRVLLFELDSVAQGPPNLADCLEEPEATIAKLQSVDEIWCAQTSAWEAEGRVHFSRVWPPSSGAWPQFDSK